MTTQKYAETYTSFSGCDLVAILEIDIPKEDGTFVKVTKVLGELQTISYSIHSEKYPVRSLGSVNAKGYTYGPRTIAGSLIFAMFDRHVLQSVILEANKHTQTKKSLLMDELPPFNVTISFANELGKSARKAIYGLQIINEGSVVSINDVYTENTYQFVATDVEYLTDQETLNTSNTKPYNSSYKTQSVLSFSQDKRPVPSETPYEDLENESNEETDMDTDIDIEDELEDVNRPTKYRAYLSTVANDWIDPVVMTYQEKDFVEFSVNTTEPLYYQKSIYENPVRVTERYFQLPIENSYTFHNRDQSKHKRFFLQEPILSHLDKLVLNKKEEELIKEITTHSDIVDLITDREETYELIPVVRSIQEKMNEILREERGAFWKLTEEKKILDNGVIDQVIIYELLRGTKKFLRKEYIYSYPSLQVGNRPAVYLIEGKMNDKIINTQIYYSLGNTLTIEEWSLNKEINNKILQAIRKGESELEESDIFYPLSIWRTLKSPYAYLPTPTVEKLEEGTTLFMPEQINDYLLSSNDESIYYAIADQRNAVQLRPVLRKRIETKHTSIKLDTRTKEIQFVWIVDKEGFPISPVTIHFEDEDLTNIFRDYQQEELEKEIRKRANENSLDSVFAEKLIAHISGKEMNDVQELLPDVYKYLLLHASWADRYKWLEVFYDLFIEKRIRKSRYFSVTPIYSRIINQFIIPKEKENQLLFSFTYDEEKEEVVSEVRKPNDRWDIKGNTIFYFYDINSKTHSGLYIIEPKNKRYNSYLAEMVVKG